MRQANFSIQTFVLIMCCLFCFKSSDSFPFPFGGTPIPTAEPSARPSLVPTNFPTLPTKLPTTTPTTSSPKAFPTRIPTVSPTTRPSVAPTTRSPTTYCPTKAPTVSPTTLLPTVRPTYTPTRSPTCFPSRLPTPSPSTTAPTPCPQGSEFDTAFAICRWCSSGKYSSSGKACVSCPAGSYAASSGLSKCQPCSDSLKSPIGASQCQSHCPSPLYVPVYPNSSQCLSCPAGRYVLSAAYSIVNPSLQQACGYCAAGTYSMAGQASCYSCSSGYYSASGSSSCSPCSAGTYGAKSASTACSLCGMGTFASVSGQSSCSLCLAGKYSASMGAISPSSCLSCLPGSISVAGASACSQCSTGTYSLSTTACSNCPAGRFSNSFGQTTCQLCPGGSENDMSGAWSEYACQSCPAGQVSLADRTGCVSCAAGSVPDPTSNFTSCAVCGVGKYALLGDATCRSCSGGQYLLAGTTTCLNCPSGTYPSSSSNVCTSCPPGKFSVSGWRECLACPANWTSSGGSSSCSQGTPHPYVANEQKLGIFVVPTASQYQIQFDSNSSTMSCSLTGQLCLDSERDILIIEDGAGDVLYKNAGNFWADVALDSLSGLSFRFLPSGNRSVSFPYWGVYFTVFPSDFAIVPTVPPTQIPATKVTFSFVLTGLNFADFDANPSLGQLLVAAFASTIGISTGQVTGTSWGAVDTTQQTSVVTLAASSMLSEVLVYVTVDDISTDEVDNMVSVFRAAVSTVSFNNTIRSFQSQFPLVVNVLCSTSILASLVNANRGDAPTPAPTLAANANASSGFVFSLFSGLAVFVGGVICCALSCCCFFYFRKHVETPLPRDYLAADNEGMIGIEAVSPDAPVPIASFSTDGTLPEASIGNRDIGWVAVSTDNSDMGASPAYFSEPSAPPLV